MSVKDKPFLALASLALVPLYRDSSLEPSQALASSRHGTSDRGPYKNGRSPGIAAKVFVCTNNSDLLKRNFSLVRCSVD